MRYFLLLIGILLGGKTLYSGTADIYEFKWLDPEKKVFVLQNKVHPNLKSWHIDIGYGSSQLSDFQDSTTINGSISYHFAEEWGIELFYSHYTNENNSSYKAVQRDSEGDVIPHVVKFNHLYGANILFSPFYGKINTFNTIFYIDWSFGVGIAQVQTEDNTTSFDDESPVDYFEQEDRMAISLKTKLRWHLSDMFKINLDFLNYYVQLPTPNSGESEEYKRSYDLLISLGLKF